MRSHSLLRRATVLVATAAMGLSLSGCWAGEESAEVEGETITITAENGEVVIPKEPKRVVATGYAVPVMLEADAPLVGISEWGRGTAMMTDEDLKTYESTEKIMGETADSINYDAVEKVDPDVIILGVPLPVLGSVNMERLEQVAPVVVLGPSVPDSWKELGGRQAEAAGVLSNWEEQKDAYYARADELKAKYADVLDGLEFGHVGAYGDITAGEFQREFAGSWGTNIAGDIGVTYYGEVKDASAGGSAEVSEYPSIEELPASLGDADWITYTIEVDGSVSPEVQYVLDSPLWQNLPAVQAGRVIALQYTEAATYASAMITLEAIDKAFGGAFADELAP
ncbi:ABC transporter substrate-binding protein [Nocardioides sp. AE5]|uniref:ABC transporter substrate-binding protein n=1 Tax=Nocardioides sp. AE5 TaxID=2962573 RepID=UPI002880D77D|nr:ABC transporter substrate-binding protein [Nocardioides sp. AE5]MDT0200885.1 ABC transporter substrate-binding protein [Nocardioides sp. AE5]